MIRIEYDADGRPLSANYQDHLIESLRDREYAEAYLNAALEDEDYRVFLLALRDVADAFGITNLASKAELNRENIYKMLTPNGNPKISSVVALLKAVGVRLKTEITVNPSAVQTATRLQKPERSKGVRRTPSKTGSLPTA